MKIREIKTPKIFYVEPKSSIQETAQKMKELNVGFMPVVEDMDDGKVAVGVVTDRDIVVRASAQGKNPSNTSVSAVMSSPVVTIDQEMQVAQAAKLMAEKQLRRLLVTDKNKQAIGVLALGDLATEWQTPASGSVLKQVSEPSEPQV